jgi:hypothetical protein
MDSTNSLSQSILQSSDSSVPSITNSYSSDEGFFSSFKNINATTWILIILILAFLGFNIFTYLAKGTQGITNIFGPLFQKLFGTTAAVAGQTVDVSAEGAKKIVGETAGAIESGLTAVQNITPEGSNIQPTSIKGQQIGHQPSDIMQQSALNNSLNKAQSQQPEYYADSASSSIQGGGKAGWCYIGEDRGFRSCAQVGVNDTCMSGEIFPSQEICMHPNLRA